MIFPRDSGITEDFYGYPRFSGISIERAAYICYNTKNSISKGAAVSAEILWNSKKNC